MSKLINATQIDFEIELIRKRLDPSNVMDFEEALKWTNKLVTLTRTSRNNALVKVKSKDKKHPVIPLRREIWTAELGKNVGVEANDFHSVLILQNDKGNEYSETTIVIPLSSLKEGEKLDNFIHHKIEKFNLEQIYKDDANDKASKVKLTDITTIDKARLIERVAILRNPTMLKVEEKIKKILAFS